MLTLALPACLPNCNKSTFWIPYTLTPNAEMLNAYRDQTAAVLKECKATMEIAEEIAGDIFHNQAVQDATAAGFAEIWKRIVDEETDERQKTDNVTSEEYFPIS